MSLLNDMLRDLSHQQKPNDILSADSNAALELNAQEQRELFNQSSAVKPLPRNFLPSLIVFVAVLVIVMLWQQWGELDSPKALTKNTVSQQTEEAILEKIAAGAAAEEYSEKINQSAIQHVEPSNQAVTSEDVSVNLQSTDSTSTPTQGDSELVARLAALESAVTTLTNTVADNKFTAAEYTPEVGSVVNGEEFTEVFDEELNEPSDVVSHQYVNASVSVKDPFALEAATANASVNQGGISQEQQKVTESAPKNQVVQALTAEPAHLEIAPNPKWQDEEKARQAQDLVAQGQVAFAIEQLQHFIASAKQPRESVKTLVDIMIEQNNLVGAQGVLAQSDFLSSNEQAFYHAKILVNQEQEEEAIELLEDNLAEADRDENYRSLLAGLYQKNGKSVEAANHYRRLLNTFGDKPAYWLGFALSQDALNESQVALQAYQRVNQYTDLPPQVRTYIQQRLAALQK